jgi:hypothetical protein
MRAETVESTQDVRTSCGRCGCVILYKSEQCVFCTPAIETLNEALEEYGLERDCFSEVHIEQGCECGCESDIAGVPAIRICDRIVHGIPELSSLRDLLLRAMMMGCFRDAPF